MNIDGTVLECDGFEFTEAMSFRHLERIVTMLRRYCATDPRKTLVIAHILGFWYSVRQGQLCE